VLVSTFGQVTLGAADDIATVDTLGLATNVSVLYHLTVETIPQIEVRPDARAGVIATSATTVVPTRFAATVTYLDPPLRLWLDMRASPATGPRIYEVRVQAPLGSGGLRSDDLRSIPLRQLRRRVIDAVTRPIVERTADGGFVAAPGEQPWFGAVQRGPGRGKPMGDDHLRQVAEVYRAAVAAGSRAPVEEVRQTFHASRPTAGRWVGQARKRGLLGPAVGTVAGEVASRPSRARKEEK